MVEPSLIDIILSCFVFLSALAFVGATAAHAYQSVRGTLVRHRQPQTVELTLQQMDGDAHPPDGLPERGLRQPPTNGDT